jgi:hypothetical protein
VPVVRWVEARIFDADWWDRLDASEGGWEDPDGDVRVDENGAPCGVWFGYRARRVIDVKVGEVL